jgi:hypothetical protein
MTHTFEVSTFFLIGYTDTEEQAQQLCEAMPKEFKEKGHFTIGITGSDDRRRRWVIYWDCHELNSKQPLLHLPFKVTPPRESWDY